MVVIERSPDQGVRIGRYTLWVLAVHAGEVVIALLDPDRDSGGADAACDCCPACGVLIFPAQAPPGPCPRCGAPRG